MFDEIEPTPPDPDTELFGRTFDTPAGRKVLERLRSIVMDRPYGPDNLDALVLAHREGQRYIVDFINRKVSKWTA